MTNILEVMLFHRTACEGADDILVELIDYCYRKFTNLCHKCENLPDGQYLRPDEKVSASDLLAKEDPGKELDQKFDEIEFTCSMSCFSLIRFISDHMDSLPVPIIHQMMENNDIPCILVPLLEFKPWLRKNANGEQEKFED